VILRQCGTLVGGYQFWGFYNGYMVAFRKVSVLSPLVLTAVHTPIFIVLTHRNTDKSAQAEHTTKGAVYLCTLVSPNESTRDMKSL